MNTFSEYYETIVSNKYYGKTGAGVVVTNNNGKILLGLRSSYVNEPSTWSYPGGKIEPDENAKKAAARELREETGIYINPSDLKKLHVFKDTENDFTYTTFIIRVDNKPDIHTNWENDRFEWFDINDLPSPLHFGFKQILPVLKNKYKYV